MIPIQTIQHRDQFGAWLTANNISGVGVEVGSLCGEFAKVILSTWTLGTLVLIDPWERQPDDVYKEPTNHSDWSAAYKSCELIRDEFNGRCLLMKAYSPQAAEQFRDGELSWLYLDSNHSYEAAKKDLEAWWNKIKAGGVFAGHDARTEFSDTQHCDVLTALNEFCAAKGLTPHISTAPGCQSFWIIKP